MESPRAREQVTQVMFDLVAAWNSHDAQIFAGRFPLDADFTDVTGHTWIGREAIESGHAIVFDRLFNRARLEVVDLRVRFLRSDVASAACRWTMTGHAAPDGTPLPERTGLIHAVLLQEHGVWWPAVFHNVDYTGTYRGTSLDEVEAARKRHRVR